jgi:hypothetical protein
LLLFDFLLLGCVPIGHHIFEAAAGFLEGFVVQTSTIFLFVEKLLVRFEMTFLDPSLVMIKRGRGEL